MNEPTTPPLVSVEGFANRLYNLHGIMLIEKVRGRPAVTITFLDQRKAIQFNHTLSELLQHRSSLSKEAHSSPEVREPEEPDLAKLIYAKADAILEDYRRTYGKPCDRSTPDGALHCGRAQGLMMAANFIEACEVIVRADATIIAGESRLGSESKNLSPPSHASGAALVAKIAQVATAVGYQADVPAMEVAGQIVSVLAANPERMDRFMAEGPRLFLDGTLNYDNGSLTYRAANGSIISPSDLREKKGQQQ